MAAQEIDPATLEDLYTWVDQVDLSRPKRDIKRDFSDGVLIAEVVGHFCPKTVEIHNYAAASKVDNKLVNWKLLNRKVFRKLNFQVRDEEMRDIALCSPWAVENFLLKLRRKIDRYVYDNEGYNLALTSEYPEADQINGPDGYLINAAPPTYLPQTKDKKTHAQNITTKASTSTVALGPSKSLKTMHKKTVAALGEVPQGHKDMVPRILVEQKQQEILAKEESIQILLAKVRRLEHLLQLKDIRIDDLTGRIEQTEAKLKPTNNYKRK